LEQPDDDDDIAQFLGDRRKLNFSRPMSRAAQVRRWSARTGGLTSALLLLCPGPSCRPSGRPSVAMGLLRSSPLGAGSPRGALVGVRRPLLRSKSPRSSRVRVSSNAGVDDAPSSAQSRRFAEQLDATVLPLREEEPFFDASVLSASFGRDDDDDDAGGGLLRVPSDASPLVSTFVRGREFLVKRDDQWRLAGPLGAGVSGNKARKLLKFAVEGPARNASVVASMGGHQSNAMVALAALCHARGVRFLYLAKPVPRWLRRYPCGNYARGLALGVELVPLPVDAYRRCAADGAFRDDLIADLVGWHDDDDDDPGGESPPEDDHDVCATADFSDAAGPRRPGDAALDESGGDSRRRTSVAWVPQGGASGDAELGLRRLARELVDATHDPTSLRVVVPAGTGTTALFLARHLAPHGARVFAVPCATSATGLETQMRALDAATGGHGVLPAVLDRPCPDGEPRYRFGVPSRRDYRVWTELREAGLAVDLLYAPHAWDVLLRTLEADDDDDSSSAGDDVAAALRDATAGPIVYLHCGGIEGVATQLTRYRREGLDVDDFLPDLLAMPRARAPDSSNRGTS